jgi:tRNA(Ile)-lysidine synthase
MVLLDAMSSVSSRGGEIAAVATFDHGTGAAARRACRLVERTAMERGIPVVSGRMTARADATEAEWRAARWRFLNAWAEELRATVVTAHTQDDQLETVVMRLLRGSGVRGLAAMQRTGSIVRPLLDVSRARVADYARTCGVPFVEDPSNQSRAHQRNRVRLDLIPALERAQPGFGAWCLDLSARAAALRAAIEAVVDDLGPRVAEDGSLALRAAPVATLRSAEWSVLWPALAARIGVTMDRRGIERAAAWAPRAAPSSHIPLAGDAEIARTGTTFVIRRRAVGTTSGDADYILNA